MRNYPGSRFGGVLAAVASSLVAWPALAHHSTAEYDASKLVEARGEVVSVLWRNPHVRFQVSTESIDGNEQLWEIESADLTRLDRAGLPRDLLKVGDVVTFAGNPSTRRDRRMYVTNLLVVDGREILLRGNVKPRWSGASAVNTEAPAQAAAPASTATGNRFVERGADLVLQNEWFEIDRLIHMDGREPPADAPYTPLGYSAGKWDGDALVITTTHIDWPYFELYGLVGVPQTRAMRIVERFTPRDGGATLRYDFAATDPGAFTEPVAYDNYVTFRWQPSLDFLPYDCVEDERKARNVR